MPAQDADHLNAVYGDPSRFLQIIINFLSNSLKFSNQGTKILVHLRIIEKQIIRLNSDNLIKMKYP